MGAIVIGLLLAALAAYLVHQRAAAPILPAPPSVEIRLPPIVPGGASNQDVQAIVDQMVPHLKPHLSPPGWTVSWDSVEIPTDYGTARLQIPPVELPFVPEAQVRALLSNIRPQVVDTPNGLGIQVTGTIS